MFNGLKEIWQKHRKRWAKKLCIKIWQYLAAYPDKQKNQTPFWEDVCKLKNACPLCELFFGKGCEGCPLDHCMNGSLYQQWDWSEGEDLCARQAAAQAIVDRVKAWDC